MQFIHASIKLFRLQTDITMITLFIQVYEGVHLNLWNCVTLNTGCPVGLSEHYNKGALKQLTAN